MKFKVRFSNDCHYGPAIEYMLREFCVVIVDSFHQLSETDVFTIVTLPVGSTFINDDMRVERVE